MRPRIPGLTVLGTGSSFAGTDRGARSGWARAGASAAAPAAINAAAVHRLRVAR